MAVLMVILMAPVGPRTSSAHQMFPDLKTRFDLTLFKQNEPRQLDKRQQDGRQRQKARRKKISKIHLTEGQFSQMTCFFRIQDRISFLENDDDGDLFSCPVWPIQACTATREIPDSTAEVETLDTASFKI